MNPRPQYRGKRIGSILECPIGATIIRGMRGLGDNINQRAFIKELGFPVLLDTPWPELYEDLPGVSFLECYTPLRTQIKNIARQPVGRFLSMDPTGYVELNVQYGSIDLRTMSILQKLSNLFGKIKPKDFDLPAFEFPSQIVTDKPIAVIRPATIRKEWPAASRNPDPKYLYQASVKLREAGFFIVSICDLEEGKEWLLGEAPVADIQFHKGELNVRELLGLVRGSSVVVGGHGWLTHAALSYKKPMFIIAGGFGGDNAPHKVADPLFLDTSYLTWAIPDNYCLCSIMAHECVKEISNFEEKVTKWIQTIVKTNTV